MKKSKKSTTKTRQNDDEVIANCAKCNHRHVYPSTERLDQAPLDTLCDNCGYPFIKHLRNKMQAMMDLLLSDPKAVALLKAEKIKELEDYFEAQTGFSKFNA
jgi:RNase P subunit RPR2